MAQITQAERLTVLVVDDEELLVRSCARILEHEEYAVLTASRGAEALELLRRHRPDIVLTDLVLPDVGGMELVREAQRIDPQMLVIMITGFATVDSSVEAIRAGAYDYIPKPFTATQLQVLVGRAANQIRLARDNERLRGQLRERDPLASVIGTSEPMRDLWALVHRVAATEASVLISGESGTGKELIARSIHQNSPRGEHPFVAVNCAAVPENLLESEMFGYERGAFTGADSVKRGLMEVASGGTLFLDEVSEMALELQAKLLRVLQERRIRRVGGEVEIPIDIRVLAATNRSPEEAVASGLLRQDFYFRLNVVPIRVPPLRERPGDVPLLAEHFLRRFARQYQRDGARPLRLSAEVVRRLMAHSWPGNVRELQNVIERLVSLAMPGQEINAADLPRAELSDVPPNGAIPGVASEGAEPDAAESEDAEATVALDLTRPFHEAKERMIEAFERAYVEAVLAKHAGNISHAARAAQIDRKTIHRLLKKYDLRLHFEGRLAVLDDAAAPDAGDAGDA